MDRDLADRAHVDEQVFRRFGEQGAAAHFDNSLMKGDVRVRVFGESLAFRAVAEPVHQPVQFGNVGFRGALGGEPRRHAFERCHDRDHLDDSRFVLRTTKMPRRGRVRTKPSCSSNVIASRIGVRLTPSPSDSSPLVEPDLLRMVVDVHRGDRPLQRGIGSCGNSCWCPAAARRVWNSGAGWLRT